MDGVFSLPEAARADFLRAMMHSFGCVYICLWHPYSHHRLFFLDGLYNHIATNNPSSAQTLFSFYQSLTFDVNDDCVPGLAYRNQMTYLELQQLDLLRLASNEIQTQFFQIAIFMGCNKGEIELGFSTMPQIDIRTALGSLFPEDFYNRPSQLILAIDQNEKTSNNNNPPSSSSSYNNNNSPWGSLSTTPSSYSPECSSSLWLTNTPHFPVVIPTMQQQQQHLPNTSSTSSTPPPKQQQQQVITNPSHFNFPITTPEGEHDAIIRAILHVISSPNSSSTTSAPNPEATTAFKRYRPGSTTTPPPRIGPNLGRQSILKRSIAFSRTLNLMRLRDRFQASRHTTSQQLHHTISERRRREQLNERFHALRALLPPGTKKDKASILKAAKATLSSLIAEIERLTTRNEQLATLLSSKGVIRSDDQLTSSVSSSNVERLNVRVSQVPESSSSEERMVDLKVIVRGESCQTDIVIRLLEFLRGVQNVSLITITANTHTSEGTSINQINLRLSIVEGSEWDESAFEEAVRRVVGDLIH